jgi:hypothetical protein
MPGRAWSPRTSVQTGAQSMFWWHTFARILVTYSIRTIDACGNYNMGARCTSAKYLMPHLKQSAAERLCLHTRELMRTVLANTIGSRSGFAFDLPEDALETHPSVVALPGKLVHQLNHLFMLCTAGMTATNRYLSSCGSVETCI